MKPKRYRLKLKSLMCPHCLRLLKAIRCPRCKHKIQGSHTQWSSYSIEQWDCHNCNFQTLIPSYDKDKEIDVEELTLKERLKHWNQFGVYIEVERVMDTMIDYKHGLREAA